MNELIPVEIWHHPECKRRRRILHSQASIHRHSADAHLTHVLAKARFAAGATEVHVFILQGLAL